MEVLDKVTINKMIICAKEAANNNNCCKHSGFTVGTALLTTDGKIYKGCNIENGGIQSICAERVAFVKALSENENEFKAIMVVGKETNDEKFTKTTPCGYCRQFISEYTDPEFLILCYDEVNNKVYQYKIKDLLPQNFKK